MRKLLPLFTPMRSPELRATPRRAEPLNQLRAGLEGLEVSDSSWDEWVAAELAELAERDPQRRGPLRTASVQQ